MGKSLKRKECRKGIHQKGGPPENIANKGD